MANKRHKPEEIVTKLRQVEELSIPPEFGGCWATFFEAWCCGGSLAANATEVARALSTLVRLWPAEVARLVSEAAPRGSGIVAPAIELGTLLHVCESAESFDEILRRLVNGERSAYSELVLVAALRRLGYNAQFAPPIAGRVLDAKCLVEGLPIYFEVVTPERSDAFAGERRLADALNQEVRNSVSKCRVEIEIRSPIDAAAIGQILAAVQSALPSVWTDVDSVARVRRIDPGQSLLPLFDGGGAQIVFAGETTVQGESTSVIVRWESSDSRAKRVFNEEYHQFSNDVANVLVVDVCAVSDGIEDWPRQMARLLQPNRNRKVGAVAFFEQGCVGPPEAIRWRWRVLINPHAQLLDMADGSCNEHCVRSNPASSGVARST